MTTITQKSLKEDSPSVQAHLGIIQNIIQRMATNSTSSKAWCITIVSAILVIIADKGKPEFANIALFPTLLFLALDTYYLGLEKGFRSSYNQFVKKLHTGSISFEDLFDVSPAGIPSAHQKEALKSFSIWGFYGTITVLIFMTKFIIISPRK